MLLHLVDESKWTKHIAFQLYNSGISASKPSLLLQWRPECYKNFVTMPNILPYYNENKTQTLHHKEANHVEFYGLVECLVSKMLLGLELSCWYCSSDGMFDLYSTHFFLHFLLNSAAIY